MKKGIVIKKLADKFWVKSDNLTYVCTSKKNLKTMGLYVGDYVCFDEFQNQVLSIEKRSSLLIRPPIANIDQLLIVVAPIPKPDLLLVDKLILFAFTNNIEPILCINKNDIVQESFVDDFTSAYKNVVNIINISAHKNIDELLKILKGKVSAFAGQSAVGKSSLTNAILPDLCLEVGDISKIERGRNTTRHTQLYEIDDNSFIADTSGFNSLDEKYLTINYEELDKYYPDFIKYISGCKFRSCNHINETNCCVKTAVKNGEIDLGRYNRYKIIYENLKKEWERKYD